MRYEVKLPKILCLMLIISKFAKEEKYYNTNDLIKIANKIKPELVRLRKDKDDYKYFDDTNFHSMIFGTGTYFWLASRYVHCASYSSNADFGLRNVHYRDLYGDDLFYSKGESYYCANRLASVVSLGSGIQVKSGSGTTSNPYVLGK